MIIRLLEKKFKSNKKKTILFNYNQFKNLIQIFKMKNQLTII